MSEDDYVELMNDAISEAEKRSMEDSIEDFYRGLLAMREMLNDRLACANGDGVQLEEL